MLLLNSDRVVLCLMLLLVGIGWLLSSGLRQDVFWGVKVGNRPSSLEYIYEDMKICFLQSVDQKHLTAVGDFAFA